MISAFRKRSGLSAGRLRRAGLVLLLGALEVACNENYRPIVIPVLPPAPSPGALHYIIAVTTNGPLDPGTASRIDASGDTYSGRFNTGLVPAHAAITPDGNKLYVANTGDDTVSVNNVGSPTIVSTIGLAPGSRPVFVNTTDSANVYVANYGNNTISQIDTTSDAVVNTIPVGNQPVALAELPNAQKLYVVNQGSGTVSSVNILGFSVGATIPVGPTPVWAVSRSDGAKVYVLDNNGTIYEIDTLADTVVGTSSSAGTGSNFIDYDGAAQRLYVTNPTNGGVTILDVTSHPPTVVSTDLNITGASQSGSNTTYNYTLASGPPLQIGSGVVVSGTANGDNGTFAVTALGAGTFTVVNPNGVNATNQNGTGMLAICTDGCSPVSVTGIGNGSRAYVASYQLGTCNDFANNPYPCISTQVTVINNTNNSISKVIPINTGIAVDTLNPTGCGPTTGPAATTPWTPGTTRFRAFATSSGGGTTSHFKVYVSQCDAGSVAIVDTLAVSTGSSPHPADVYTASLGAPLSSFPQQQATISAANSSNGSTTYTYSLNSGPGLEVGMNVLVAGMSDAGNNGYFVISSMGTSSTGTGTFTVANAGGVTASSQTGSGLVLPPQNPGFVLAGP